MKKPTGVFIAVLLTASIVWPQIVIKNPAKPPAKNAGRVVKLERILTIKGAAPDDLLRGPYDIQVGSDGSTYFYDHFEFYKFSPEGKFLFKLVRPGQGPGEAEMRTVAAVKDDAIIISAWSPPKVMWFDRSGHLKDERKTEDTRPYLYLFSVGGNLYGFREGDIIPSPGIKEGYIDIPTTLFAIAPDFKTCVDKSSFPVQNYVIQGGGASWQSLFLSYALQGDDILFIAHTVDYQLLKYSLRLNKIERTFGRRYQRVPRPPEKEPALPAGIKALSPPPRKYYVDVSTLLVHGDRLWVITSTRDSGQNRLVDVYDFDGHYLDNFYLQYPEGISHTSFYWTVAMRGDKLYSIDEEKDGTMSVNVYRIKD